MNWIDLIIVILIAFSVISGFSNGLVREVASLAGLILGIWGAIRFSGFTALTLNEWFDMSGRYTGIIAFIITFCAIVVIIHFIGVLADKIIDTVSLGFLNRLLGMIFGAIKNILILSVIFSVFNAIEERRHFLPKSVEESKFYQPVSGIVPSIFPVIWKGHSKQGLDRFRKEPRSIQATDTTEVAI
jgi:membrane protein required for colicin V production